MRRTGCKKPCSYSSYKFMNSNPREIVVAEFPKDQIGFALWAVSQNTQFEEEVQLVYLDICTLHLYSSGMSVRVYELYSYITYIRGKTSFFGPKEHENYEKLNWQVLLYPFTSLMAEFGGSLGLFCGFSFLTIWDGLKELPAWMKRNIKRF